MKHGVKSQPKLTHFDEAGSARMVDVSAKSVTQRTARAQAFVKIRPEVLADAPVETAPASKAITTPASTSVAATERARS